MLHQRNFRVRDRDKLRVGVVLAAGAMLTANALLTAVGTADLTKLAQDPFERFAERFVSKPGGAKPVAALPSSLPVPLDTYIPTPP